MCKGNLVADYIDPPGAINRLVVAVVNPDDADPLVRHLTAQGFRLTRLESAGGFLRRGNATLLIGIPSARLEELLEMIQVECLTRAYLTSDLFTQSTSDLLPVLPVEVQVGGATVFILDVEKTIYLEAG